MNLHIKEIGMFVILTILIGLTANFSSDTAANTTAIAAGTSRSNSVTLKNDINNSITSGNDGLSKPTIDLADVDAIETNSNDADVTPSGDGLSVKGTDLVDAEGNPLQLRGVSTHGINWYPQYVSKESFQTLKDWGANAVRLAMYTAESDGYCTGNDFNRVSLKQTLFKGIDACTDLGMYVIVDWHILSDSNPITYQNQAIDFFREVSSKYKNNNNIIYEICNEPNGSTTWADIRKYAAKVIPAIKKNDPDAVIIVGTPTWSQELDKAVEDPITEYTNIMYSLHFYADTHKDELRKTMESAHEAGLPVMVTEFGLCASDGNGNNNTEQGKAWIDELNKFNISYFMWSLSNKAETCSLLDSNCKSTSGWGNSDLSEAGKWYLGVLGDKKTNSYYSAPAVTAANDSATQAASSQADATDCQVSSDLVSKWQSGRASFSQYSLTITNSGSKVVDDWTITVKFDHKVGLSQCWNGDGKASGDTITIKSQAIDSKIPAGSSLTDIGFIITSDSECKITSVTVQ